jgi:hypothetical protein
VSRLVTLLQLRTDISAQADIVGGTGRYPTATLNRFINQSIQRFREKLSSEGAQHFLTNVTGTITAGATAPYPFAVIDLTAVSPSVVRVYGVDVTLTSGVVTTLSHSPFQQRTDFGGPIVTGEPRAWSNFNTRKIAIMPATNQSYPYNVWYLPVLADLALDADTWDGVAGWEDFIVWDVVCRLIIRDQYLTAYQTATGYRQELWADILRNATRVTSAGGAALGRDSMGDRGMLDSWRRNRVLPPP